MKIGIIVVNLLVGADIQKVSIILGVMSVLNLLDSGVPGNMLQSLCHKLNSIIYLNFISSDRYAERPYAYLHRQLPPNATESNSSESSKVSDDIIDFKKDVEPLESNSFQISRTGQDLQQQPSNGLRYLVKTKCNKTDNLETANNADHIDNNEDVQIVQLQQN